jgi:type II secretory pathway pseudopilin PulG
MNSSAFPTARQRVRDQGFALVATLAMLILLVVVAVGMLSLSTVSLRTSGTDTAAQRARANARLALQLAIGELQAAAGPDNRVTAPSAIGKSDRAQKNLTGVWEGWQWKGEGDAPDWKKEKEDRFKGWLVSSSSAEDAKQEEYADSEVSGEKITLVDAVGDDAKVDAQIVKLANSLGKPTGGVAWGVFDESQKANIALSAEDPADTYEHKYDRMSAAHELGYKAAKDSAWKVLSEKKDERAKLLSVEQSRLIGVKKEDTSFHDMTSGSLGLLTNVVDGGFATDISRLFDEDELPKSFESRFIYSGKDTPLVPPPARFNGANPLPSPDPTWALLRSHYRTYDLLGSGAKPEINANVKNIEERPNAANPPTGETLLRHPSFNKQQLAPVLAKAQFIFSLSFGYGGTLDEMWKAGSARTSPARLKDNYMTWLAIDPVITLWNPYNVPIRFTEETIELYRIPLAFRLYKNGVLLNSNYTSLTNTYTVADFADRKEKNYLLKILPETGQPSVLLEPGEHMVFTAHNWRPHGKQQASEEGLLLRPGFNPPAGAASSPEIGGITTMNLFVDSKGAKSGTDYGKSIRTVAVKGGDKIEIDVKAERAGNDTLPEAGGKEVTGFLKYYMGNEDNKKLIGGIELDYGDREKEFLPPYSRHELPAIVIDGSIPTEVLGDGLAAMRSLRYKEPFLIATFQQKTERDSKFPSRSWLNNAPTNLYASAGLDQTEAFAHQQYELKWEPMFDWPPDSPTIEISTKRNRGYGGSGVYAQTGSEIASFSSLPRGPAHSLGQFTHAPLNAGGQLPLTSHVVANSFAPPLIKSDHVKEASGNRTFLDHSYLANNALFDGYFLSSAADHPALEGGKIRKGDELLKEFFEGTKRLPNSRFIPYLGTSSAEDVTERLLDDEESHLHLAANLLLEAPFNVNSTRVAAWEAVLASNNDQATPLADGGVDEAEGLPVSRNLPANGPSYEADGSDPTKWAGYRRLTQKQIEKLALEVVEEVKKRGPFQSLAEFINRRPGDGELARSGALQTAIERAELNSSVLDPQSDFAGTTGANAEAGSGNTADGAPGVISQSDLLTPIIPQLRARGDTFVVRAYGEASDASGRKTQAWCEATVQRFPEYVDPTDAATAAPVAASNILFGRRFQVVSFRWVQPTKI